MLGHTDPVSSAVAAFVRYSPDTDPLTPDQAQTISVELMIGALAVAIIGGTLTYALLRAADKTPQVMVTLSLSLLTLVSLIGFVLTESETLGAIAASGIGALAGAVSGIFNPTRRSELTAAKQEPSMDEAESTEPEPAPDAETPPEVDEPPQNKI